LIQYARSQWVLPPHRSESLRLDPPCEHWDEELEDDASRDNRGIEFVIVERVRCALVEDNSSFIAMKYCSASTKTAVEVATSGQQDENQDWNGKNDIFKPD
jgi:hypothetical protein